MTKIAIRKPKFIFLGNKIKKPSLILSNHVGSRAPITLELYAPFKNRLLGTYQMNGNIKELYKYLSETYYYKKRKFNYALAKCWSFIATPFVYYFYRGLKLISIYDDYRFINTIKQSYKVLTEFKENIVIFPEDSSNGYKDKLNKFYSGFILICEYAYKKGYDLDIVLAYLKHKNRQYIFDNPLTYSSLLKQFKTREQIVNFLLKKCNNLANVRIE